MPQKPQVRAKDKRRLTKRLAKWRAKQEQHALPVEPLGLPVGERGEIQGSLDGGGSAGGVGASAPAAVDYSVATRTPSGDVTGTTPVIAQGAKSVKASASAPVVTGETATAKKTKAYQAASSEDSSAAVVNVTMTTPVATKAASTPIYNLTSTMPPPVYTPPAGPLTQRSAAPAAPEATPSQQLQGGGDVHVHLHIGNVQAWDSRGVHDYLTGPEIRRHIAEAVRMHEGKR
jgi:hypothetical protein